MSSTVGVIGSGLGGLSAACVLAARGYKVSLFEKNDWVGGKAAVLNEDGFRFDMGPTILICPSVLRKIFAEAGRELSRYLHLVPLEPEWRSFFEDGSVLDLYSDQARMKEELDRFSPGTSAGYQKIFERLRGASPDLEPLLLLALDRVDEGHVRDRICAESLAVEGCEPDAPGPYGRRHDSERHQRQARGADAGPHGAVCWLVAGENARDSLRHCPYAGGGRRLVSDGRNARHSECAYSLSDRVRRRDSDELRHRTNRGGRGPRARDRNGERRLCPARCGGGEFRCGAYPSGADRRRTGEAFRPEAPV